MRKITRRMMFIPGRVFLVILCLFSVLIVSGNASDCFSQSTKNKLLDAVKKGKTKRVKQLISEGARVDVRDEQNNTPLHLACLQGNRTLFNVLRKAGARIDTVGGKSAQTPLIMAIRGGNSRIINLLLEQGASVHFLDHRNRTPVHYAVEQGQFDILKKLSKKGARLDLKTQKGRTSLMIAALHGHKHIVEYLLQNGAKVSRSDHKKNTALHFAARDGNPGVNTLLLKAGADVNAKNEEKQTPLMITNNPDTAKILLENGATLSAKDSSENTPLTNSAEKGNKDMVELLQTYAEKQKKSDLNLKKAFRAAIEHGHYDIVTRLVRAGVDINTKTPDQDHAKGKPYLIHAADEGHMKMVQYLIKHGVDPDVRWTETGGTALMAAAWEGNVSIVKYLLKQGASVKARNKSKRTAFLYATAPGTVFIHLRKLIHSAERKDIPALTSSEKSKNQRLLETAKMLRKAGSDVNVSSKRGFTPLMGAAMFGRIQMARFLLNEGVDVNAKNQNGWTALQIAGIAGQEKMVRLLLRAGANPNIKNKKGDTVLGLAREKGYKTIAKMLKTYPDKLINDVLKSAKKPDQKTVKKVKDLIQQLGAKNYSARQKAERKLKSIGGDALYVLKQYRDHSNPEIRTRVQKLIKPISRKVIKHNIKKE